MFLVYNIALIILALILLPFILVAFILVPKLRAGFWQKLGFYGNLNKDKTKKTLWFHAVSVGEVNAIEPLIKKCSKVFTEYNIILSTTTKTGQNLANNKLKNICTDIIYFPYDFSFSVNAALEAVTPQKIIIAETEIWPNFSLQASKQNIPLLIVNARISPNSHKGYKKISFFMKKVLEKYSHILAQTQGDAQRLIDIGAPKENVQVMGNLKFDISQNLNQEEVETLKAQLLITSNRVLIAGSTHVGEDEIVLNVYKKLKNKFGDLKLIIAPRHPERNNQVETLLQQSGYSYGKRSNENTLEANDIMLLDTIGELAKFYAVCSIAFIGGSFSNTGGHNPLEAVVWGKPIVSGNIVFNFKDIYKYLTQTKAATLAEDEQSLFNNIDNLLSDTNSYREACNDCEKIFKNNKGAVTFAVNILKNN